MSRKTDDFFFALQRTVRAQTGKALTPLLKRWRYTQSSDESQLPLKPDTLRFLVRYGALDGGKSAENMNGDYHRLLQNLSRASGDAPGVVAAWIELFATGEYGILERGICAAEPSCALCELKEKCRYLASGGTDSRTFGSSLARDLRTSSGIDAKSADLLAFMFAGEMSGAADIARAEALLKATNGLRGLFLAKPEDLRNAGCPDTAVSCIRTLAELCRLWADERVSRGNSFASAKDFFDFFHLHLRDLKKEVLLVVLLDQKNALIDHIQVSEGSLTETLAHPREVFSDAISKRAAAIAVIHNHPTGDPAPSEADKSITKRLNSVARVVGIRFLDHIIIGDGRFFSFVEEGLMP